MLQGNDACKWQSIVISESLRLCKHRSTICPYRAHQDSVPDCAYRPRTGAFGQRERRFDGIPEKVFIVQSVQALLIGAREPFGRGLSPLDHANCSEHIILCISECLSVLSRSGVDGVAAFIVELDVVVSVEVLVSSREFCLRRFELQEVLGLYHFLGGLEC
jgi:hypothetical protein